MKMIVLNGPPRSGKDTFLKLLKAVFMDDLPTDTMIPFSYKWVLCEGVARRYGVTTQAIWDLNANTLTKDKPKKLFGGKSVRQCLIYESEEVIKKELGENGVAIKTFQNIKDDIDLLNIELEDCVLVTPDGGFEGEMRYAMDFFGIPRYNILLIQFNREGCTFEGDSRGFISNPDMIIQNVEGDKVELTRYLRRVQEFIGRTDELDGGELDTLYQLVMNGPLESGDMPSKTGFENLCKRGLAMRDSDTWLGYVNYNGIALFKKLEWRGVLGSEILSPNREIACRQDPNDLQELRGIAVMETVTGKQMVIRK